ncbi:hypothetical protein EJ08DRAFT_671672 [Tothia fuscella]|uniref:Uncharacterized protein n=1 Tax=Tothia fuscella TaxID=1048955 RepID=A0A9P4NMG7_9PEZI|nr:hypothetical protein EJ08DRAFT_671672 [Tothia fuscella]
MVATLKEPVEKLPLALRKNLRDSFTAKKEELEGQLSTLLGGEAWTIDVNPNLLFAYAPEGSYGYSSLGDCIKDYVEGAIYQMKYNFESRGHGEEGIAELNSLASKHVLTIYPDLEGKFSYCGVDIKDGELRILFTEGNLGSNINYALSELPKAINDASIAAGNNPLPYFARHSIKEDYTGKIEELRKKIAKQLHNDDIKLEPNFEATAAALKKDKEARDDWPTNIGGFIYSYFESVEYYMQYNKFEEDDLMYEGFAEQVPKGVIEFNIVPKLGESRSYNEIVIKDGVCALQTQPQNFGTNINQVADKIVDIL